MARNLYRIYLYVVCIALLIFAAVGLEGLLQSLFAFTPLRGSDNPLPSNSTVVQAVVFFVVSWIIALALGGLHYWLLRRDMHNDPSAGESAIRSFFLNLVEFLAVPIAVGLSISVIQSFGEVYVGNSTTTAAISLSMLAFVAAIEWERRRTQPAPGVAILFQRLNLYGVQLILLIEFTFVWLSTVRLLIDDLLFAGQGSLSVNGTAACGGFTVCQGPNLLSVVASTLWVALFWIGYGRLARNDTPSLLRQILHYGSIAYGLGFGLYGIERGIELLLRLIMGNPAALGDVIGPAANYDFVSPLSLGLVVIGVYSVWLRQAAHGQKEEWERILLIIEALAGILFAIVFWWGIGFIVLNTLESLSGAAVTQTNWASAIALTITGVSYFLFDILLLRSSTRQPLIASSPRRGLVLALLGGGILAGAVGAAIALYAVGTSLLGSPLNNWAHISRTGIAAFIVGVIVTGIYLWRTRREHLFTGFAKLSVPVVPATQPAPVDTSTSSAAHSTIEGVLDDLLAGKITRDEAVTQLRAMTEQHVVA